MGEISFRFAGLSLLANGAVTGRRAAGAQPPTGAAVGGLLRGGDPRGARRSRASGGRSKDGKPAAGTWEFPPTTREPRPPRLLAWQTTEGKGETAWTYGIHRA